MLVVIQDRKGAERLLKLAFPVADIFDNLLMDLGGGSEQSQQEAIELLGLDSEKDLKAFHFMPAVFGQWSRQRVVPQALHSNLRATDSGSRLLEVRQQEGVGHARAKT